jgi:hypothetical protein
MLRPPMLHFSAHVKAQALFPAAFTQFTPRFNIPLTMKAQ